jgi:threonine dehydratase
MVDLSDVEEAATRIAGHVRRTPVLIAEGDAFGVRNPVALKLELFQHTGSFKARGAFNRALAARERGELPESGLIGASGGNSGLAIAHVARTLGLRAEIFVPTVTSEVKVARLKDLGATVVIDGDLYADAYDACLQRWQATGALLIHAYDQPEVVAGQGTLGLELLNQLEGVDSVLVAVGGGGLAGGLSLALAGRARVVAVEPDGIPTLHAALDAGAPVDVEVTGIAADSLGARRVGDIAYELTSKTGVQSILVSDASIIRARELLWAQFRIAAEHGGAAALAALLQGVYVPEPGERTAVIVCGGNTDPADLALKQPVGSAPPST